MFIGSKLRNVLSISLLLGTVTAASPAYSQGYIPTEGCTDYYEDQFWPHPQVCYEWTQPVTMARYTCGIPPGGQRDQAFSHAFTHWGTYLYGMDTMLNAGLYWPAEDCTVNHGDGWSDYAVVPGSEISGYDGKEITITDPFAHEIVESDVLISADLSFAFDDLNESLPTRSGSVGAGYDAIVHEFGHSLGIDHSTAWGGPLLSRMKNGRPLPLVGTSSTSFPFEGSPMHWEAAVARALYPDGGEVNVMTSAQKAQNGSIVPNEPTSSAGANWEWYVGTCQCFTADYRIINRGAQSKNVTHRFFMNASSTAHLVGGPYTFNQPTQTVAAESTKGGQRSICPSQVPPGWYYLYHQVDYTHSINENIEADNVVRFIAQIAVLPC